MTKVTLTVHGQIVNLVLRRTPSGGMSLIKLADMSEVQWSPAQKAYRKKFKAAIAYAKAAMAKPEVRLIYEKAARKQKKPAFRLAVSDYLKGKNLLSS